MTMKKAKDTTGRHWSRAIAVLIISIPAFWLVYQLLLRLLPRAGGGGGLSEFGGYLVGYIASMLSGAYFLWLVEGQFFNRTKSDTGLSTSSTSIQVGLNNAPLAISLLSVLWLINWLYVTLLKRTLDHHY